MGVIYFDLGGLPAYGHGGGGLGAGCGLLYNLGVFVESELVKKTEELSLIHISEPTRPY